MNHELPATPAALQAHIAELEQQLRLSDEGVSQLAQRCLELEQQLLVCQTELAKHSTETDNFTLTLPQLFYDTGSGFSPRECLIAAEDAHNELTHEVSVTFVLPEDARAVRLDPGELACCITDLAISDERISFQSVNGLMLQEDCLLFLDVDPNLSLHCTTGFSAGMKFAVNYHYYPLGRFLHEQPGKSLLRALNELKLKNAAAAQKKLCFGVIIGTRAYFNSALAKDVRKQLLKTIEEQGYDYVILPEDATPTGSSSIETREDGIKCAELFRQNRDKIDGIIVSLPNFGFEIGIINAISIADLNVPVLVQACDDENDKVDLDSRRDAFCGKISVCNNLYQYGIPFTDTTLHTYSIYSDLLAKDINRFAAVCRVVNGLRHARIGAIGTRPAGFQTVRASEKILQATGITVVPVDLSEILGAARKIEDTDAELVQKIEEIKKYARVPQQYSEKLMLQAKFGVAVERWMNANAIDAVAIQCWDSLEQNYGCAACVTMSMLGEKLIPAACEVDIAGAVSMYALTLASQHQSALLDWNNNFAEDRNKCVCTHCGNFPKSFIP